MTCSTTPTTTTTTTACPTTSGPGPPEGATQLLRPDHYVTDVRAIDLDALATSGIRAMLLDIDNTLLPRDTSVFPPEFVSWLGELSAVGMSAYLVSNNWHDHIFDRAAELGLPIVAKACKPLPFGFLTAARTLGFSARQCAVVGDQIFTDVLGGNLVGATTVLVKPLSSSDLPHTLVLRRIERVIMAGRQPAARPSP